MNQEEDADEAFHGVGHADRGHFLKKEKERQVKCSPNKCEDQKRVEYALQHKTGALRLPSPPNIFAADISIKISHGNTSLGNIRKNSIAVLTGGVNEIYMGCA